MAQIEDMTDALELVGLAPLKRRRPSTTYTGGRAISAAATETTIDALVMPLSGRDTQKLPENLRAMETRQVFTAEVLRGADPGQQPDEVLIEGKWWQVQTVGDWVSLAGYIRAIVARPRP